MTYVIIVAAGSGRRFGGDLPKQFCELDGKPVLVHTVERVRHALPQARVAVVLHPDYIDFWDEQCRRYGLETTMVAGGATRWESVKNAIEALAPEDAAVVMVHDGARPIVPAEMLRRIAEAMNVADAVVPAIPVTDSLRLVGGDALASPGSVENLQHRDAPGDAKASPPSRAVDRSRLVAVQTPQAFRAAKLKAAYRLPYSPSFTDDASVYEAAGYGSPALVDGDPRNIKITHPLDLAVAKLYL